MTTDRQLGDDIENQGKTTQVDPQPSSTESFGHVLRESVNLEKQNYHSVSCQTKF